MSRDIKDIAKDVRAKLKKQFPKCKFSVRIERYSMGQSLHLSLMSAPFNPFKLEPSHRDGVQLNHFTFNKSDWDSANGLNNGAYLTKRCWDVLTKACEIANTENWDKSDSMIDYFDVNYYFHVNIGQFEKPFVQTSKTKKG